MALSSESYAALLGRAVKVTLKCGVFQGVLQHVNPDRRSLLLRAVKNLETGRSSPGIKVFFAPEIVTVELLDEPDSGKGTTVLSECTSSVERNKQVDTGPAGCGSGSSPVPLESQLRASSNLKCSLSAPNQEVMLQLPLKQPVFVSKNQNFGSCSRLYISESGGSVTSLEKKEEENVEYTVIDSFQEKIGPAVLHLKQQCVVSIAGEGVNLCRYGKLSWLEIASKSRIFLFDIFLLGPQAFKNGLQMLLEDKNILKVMHDCRWISDCLFHQYGVLLCNVFDTQVADALQFSVETGGFLPHRVCTLQECLMQHLKIPSKWAAIMNCRQQMASECNRAWLRAWLRCLHSAPLSIQFTLAYAKENPDIWFLRPFPPSLLKALALEAMHLLLLHSSLMENLMSDLTAIVHGYLNTYRSGSGGHLCSTKPTCMELPKELRQLLDIQTLRKERAIRNYKMNKDGLLIRPTPMEFKKRNDPQEDGNYGDDVDHSPTNKVVSHLASFYNRDVLCQEKLEKSKSRGESVEEP